MADEGIKIIAKIRRQSLVYRIRRKNVSAVKLSFSAHMATPGTGSGSGSGSM